jgi:hypothetical protein
VTVGSAALKAGETATITFTLSEASTNFAVGDVSATGGVLSSFTGSGTSYSATFTPTVNSTTAGRISVAAGKFTDAAGNGNMAGSHSPALVIDTVRPTVSIRRTTTGALTTVIFTLSSVSTDFNASKLTVVGGTVSNFGHHGTALPRRVYRTTFQRTPGFIGPFSISVGAGTFTDTAGNGNIANSRSWS